MKPDIDKHDKYVLLKVNEIKFNAITSAELKADFIKLNDDGHHNIIVDLSAVKFIDSSGLSSLLVGHKLCKDAGGVFILCGLNNAVVRLLAIAQLNTILTIVPTTDDAMAQLTGQES